ncbi:hypothetical protein EYF80_056851 [Liparis tanakae]|uniref:Uncharacterized protein n=1 Tax=Liparis tanakae TaxID=230148 RepID=A0A4Z2EW02_9TELE|nr:hypothetical protein EYF80_056851 [Liparis tanakae]
MLQEVKEEGPGSVERGAGFILKNTDEGKGEDLVGSFDKWYTIGKEKRREERERRAKDEGGAMSALVIVGGAYPASPWGRSPGA